MLSDSKEKKIRTRWTFTDNDKEVPMGEASNNILLIAKMRGDGILWKWRTLRDKLMDEKNMKRHNN